MRARSWALRDALPDVLRGLGVTEEVQDMGELRQTDGGTYVHETRPQRADFKNTTEARYRTSRTTRSTRRDRRHVLFIDIGPFLDVFEQAGCFDQSQRA